MKIFYKNLLIPGQKINLYIYLKKYTYYMKLNINFQLGMKNHNSIFDTTLVISMLETKN